MEGDILLISHWKRMVGLRYADPVRMLTWKGIECCGPVKINGKIDFAVEHVSESSMCCAKYLSSGGDSLQTAMMPNRTLRFSKR